MIEYTYFLRPLVGAVIGYITNDIAIRMLFRPRTAKYLFGFKIPFTPGLIPKEKARIASSIGDAISKNLMNHEVLERTLLSDDITGKIARGFDDFFATQKVNPETLRQLLAHYVSAEDLDAMSKSVSADLSVQIQGALVNADLGKRLAALATQHVMQKVSVDFMGGILGRMGADRVVSLVAGPLEKLLAKNIDEMIRNHAGQMTGTLIDDQIGALLDTPVCSLLQGRDRQIASLRTTVLGLYRRLISEQLPRALETVDISRMIEQRINEMDVRETERLILEVMRKELKAIVWLGALLGFVMGCVNLLF